MKAPFPYFGGKGRIADRVWELLGDPGGYVEPFAGSAAVLLARPKFSGRRVETLNDFDGWLVNVWRSLKHDPAGVAEHAFGPVTEIDYHARLAWLQNRRNDGLVSWLEGDPEVYDAKAAGWWLYVAACGIGDPWGNGPWVVQDGRLVDSRALPHLGNAGRGVNRALPHLGNAGRGVNRALPHLGNAGQGVNRELPHLGNAGQDKLETYLRTFQKRLERVRITCGDWRRVLKPSVTRATASNGERAIFLDPPYSTSGDLYASTNTSDEHVSMSAEVREWCINNHDNMKIVLAGYDIEHDELLKYGWRKELGKAGGGAGYNTNADAGKRERLWVSPACLTDGLF